MGMVLVGVCVRIRWHRIGLGLGAVVVSLV